MYLDLDLAPNLVNGLHLMELDTWIAVLLVQLAITHRGSVLYGLDKKQSLSHQ